MRILILFCVVTATFSAFLDNVTTIGGNVEIIKNSVLTSLAGLDNLETVSGMNIETVQNLRWLLFRGPARRVWPIITLNSNRIQNMEVWLDLFRTRIFGHMRNPNHINKLGVKYADPASLTRGSEFTMSEGSEWLRFSIPELE